MLKCKKVITSIYAIFILFNVLKCIIAKREEENV